VIKAITACRTKALGKKSYACKDCGSIMHVYHSCRNRHCPKCQYHAREKWLREREKELLPVKYFHIVFTVPHCLNEIALYNKRLFYETLFSAANFTLNHFARDNKWMGAQYGAVAILHSWGQNLSFHPHLHLAVPAGGISEDGMEWRATRVNFFAPVREMSKIFCEKFSNLLQSKLDVCSFSSVLDMKFNALIKKAEMKKWVVFVQDIFENPQYIIDYFGNYTHRVAISNGRLIKLEDGYVHIHYKDYNQDGKRKQTRLRVMEFIRRFLQHVLPYSFRKIRYFGFLSNRFKTQKLGLARTCLIQQGFRTVKLKQNIKKELSKIESEINLLSGICICPYCGGTMIPLAYAESNMSELIDDG